jgi:beta-lactamase superfamily II metal-dependent hydrolase
MSYVIRTDKGRLAVVDGGLKDDAEYLRGFIAALGNNVDIWIITHPHDDHAGALNEIFKDGLNGLRIKSIYMSSLDREWYKDVEKDCTAFSDEFYANVKKSGIEVVECVPGMTFHLDNAAFRILGVKNPEFTMNAYNNSSVTFKVEDSRKSVLFLGDLGVEGGEKLLHGQYAKYLKSDYVQMAHHGQNGVDEDFYKAVQPKYCLWPTPLWLWNDDIGKGVGSGPWKTLVVRGWIEKLHVKRNYVACMGLVKIE